MADVNFNAERVGGYAKLTARGAQTLDDGKTRIGKPLEHEAFGAIGRSMHSTQAYSRASSMLREQLGHGIEALRSASSGLKEITEKYRESDEDNVRELKRGEREKA